MIARIRAAADQLASLLPDALLVAGAAAVAWGAHQVYAPAGYVVGGLFLLAGGVVLSRGGR
jgi:hypothetical protein